MRYSRPPRCAANCASNHCGRIEISNARAFTLTCSRSSSKRSTAPVSSAGAAETYCWPAGSGSRRQADRQAAPGSHSAGGCAWCSTPMSRPCLGACGRPFDGIAGRQGGRNTRRAGVRRMLSAGLRSSIRSGGSKPYRAGSYRPHALSTGQGTAKCASGGAVSLRRPRNTGFRGRESAQAWAALDASAPCPGRLGRPVSREKRVSARGRGWPCVTPLAPAHGHVPAAGPAPGAWRTHCGSAACSRPPARGCRPC